ncbi:LTA synthase family protein [Paenibacillus spongiae]|uniref:LTA synthase family protein n=1 Tax=Paenibacillus spongiae TaxID=2909671 RepID=A0ABY5S6P0_9BACL|nr:LTA synthase family protein [Paenibacillus spongiae]UVI28215.1 LTA synthase family protein [Paenibacillus spongiae]
MAGPLQNAPRGVFKRLSSIELPLFFVVMLIKLYMFDRYVNVPYMKMGVDDFIIAIGTLALVSFWTIWLPKRGRIIALILLDLILTFVIYADLVYYRYFQDLITVPVLTQAGQVGSLGESIGSLMKPVDIWFFVDWLILIPLAFYVLFRFKKPVRSTLSFVPRNRWRKVITRLSLSLIVFAAGIALVFVPVNIAKKTWASGLFVGNWWNMSLYNVTGVLGFHGYDVYRYANQHWFQSGEAPAEEAAAAKNWFEERGSVRKQLESDKLFGKYKGSNVILIQLEAFQNFVIGQKINGQEVTPNMNKLIGESVYFNRFYHQTSQGRTSDADLAANISLQPLQSGSVFITNAHNQFDSLPATLKDEGYAAAVFHAYEGGFWNRNNMYANMQYDYFYNKKDFQMDEPLGWSLGDESFFQQSVDAMTKEKQPFYSFLISLSSHHPYSLPASYQKLNVGDMQGTIFGDYLQSVHYVDSALGLMIERLKKEGLWDNSIFLFYGDHDNSINDWEPFEKFLGKPLTDMDRQQILKQIPFVVHLPDSANAGIRKEVGGQLDIAPTILHLLGISTADKYMIGTPLIIEKPLEGKKVVFRNGSYTDGSVWYKPSPDGIEANSQCLSADTGEKLDLNACTGGGEEARTEINMSDLVIKYDLIREFRKQQKP